METRSDVQNGTAPPRELSVPVEGNVGSLTTKQSATVCLLVKQSGADAPAVGDWPAVFAQHDYAPLPGEIRDDVITRRGPELQEIIKNTRRTLHLVGGLGVVEETAVLHHHRLRRFPTIVWLSPLKPSALGIGESG
jgi:hypothetical protein